MLSIISTFSLICQLVIVAVAHAVKSTDTLMDSCYLDVTDCWQEITEQKCNPQNMCHHLAGVAFITQCGHSFIKDSFECKGGQSYSLV